MLRPILFFLLSLTLIGCSLSVSDGAPLKELYTATPMSDSAQGIADHSFSVRVRYQNRTGPPFICAPAAASAPCTRLRRWPRTLRDPATKNPGRAEVVPKSLFPPARCDGIRFGLRAPPHATARPTSHLAYWKARFASSTRHRAAKPSTLASSPIACLAPTSSSTGSPSEPSSLLANRDRRV